MASRPMFYIIDGYALAYRQFFALPVASFSTRSGEPTNAVYGFARTILDIMQRNQPEYIAVSFDRGLSGRETWYGDYKGTREKMPGELLTQIDRIAQLVEAFNMPLLAMDGYEADDVIGSVAPQAEAQGVDIRVVTGDRDILQLLTDHVTVQLPRKGEADVVFDVAKFREEYQLEPWQLVEWKGLVGDTSDNIPGVKGIGDKGATKLLQQYQTVANIYDHIDEITGATQKKLIEGKDSAFLSQRLATIQKDVPITLNLQACTAHDYDLRKVDELFGLLEFRQLRDRLPKASAQMSLFDTAAISDIPAEEEKRPPVVETIIVQDEAGLQALVETLNAAKTISWDTETTGTDPMSAALVGISVAVDGDKGYYIPVGHKDGTQLPLETVMNALREPLNNPAIGKQGHNADYDLLMLQRYGVDVKPVTFDTMIAEWLRSPDSKFLGLKNLARQELQVDMTEISELIGTGKKQITMDSVSIERAAPYAAADAALTHRLADLLRPKLEEMSLMGLYHDLELPLIPVIAAIERVGVVLDKQHLAELSTRLNEMLAQVEEEIYTVSGYGKFNINSPKQLNDVLFGKLGLSVEGLKKTTHGYSTDATVLESLSGQHIVVDKILNYREVSKLKSTYVEALPTLINPLTGRVHTSYNQTGTVTGRISSNSPNLQNIPVRTELGREVRRAFVAAEGTKLLSVDYSQVELRILAHISQDKTLLEAFAAGQDIHAATAAAVYGIPVEAVTKAQRSFAKRVNFGLIYGMGAYRLARDSELTLAEAREFIKTYFERLPGVEKYLDDTKQAARQGPITTLFGRRREFGLLRRADSTSNKVAVQAEERVAINMPIQGTAADIMKQAMINLYGELQAKKLTGKMILQVHDELVLEVPDAEVAETRDVVVRVMEDAYKLDAPLRANANVGDNWRDMISI
ncbi:MAG: DNA polymerase I [Chloroflexi bacterium]|nr:DNA polymerase I [Chloroflexota bacterium]MCC6891787.1 DNA polymerase I [Anaerolineae bacterium]